MATKTRADLVTLALIDLLVIGSGDDLQVADTATMDEFVDPLLADLEARGICFVGNSDEIELALYLPLGELLANEAAPAFGQQKNLAKQVECEERLRVVTRRIAPPNRLLQSDTALLGSASPVTYTNWLRGRF